MGKSLLVTLMDKGHANPDFILTEVKALQSVSSPFVAKLYKGFQTEVSAGFPSTAFRNLP